MAQIIQLRRDYSSNWTNANPVLAQGEIGVQLDDYKQKIGNGVSSWNDLTFMSAATGGGGDWSISSVTGPSILITSGSVNTLYQPSFLTTAAASDHTHSQYQSTGVYLTTAALSNHTHSDLYQSTGAYLTTAALSNHTHSQYLTTAALSNHTHSDLYQKIGRAHV